MVESFQAAGKEKRKWRKRVQRIFMLFVLVVSLLCVGLWGLVTQPFVSSMKTNHPPKEVSPGRLEAHVRMLAETLSPRDATHPENLDKVAAYISKEFETAKGTVSEQPFTVDGNTYRNVIGTFGPETKERIVVGAHYDTCGPLPGADDNASGVAALIELAYLLGSTSLPMKVELVAYTLEEPPYFRTKNMGSAVHAQSLKNQGVQVRMMFSLEMVGYFTDSPKTQAYPLPLLSLCYPSTGNFIAIASTTGQGMPVRRVKAAMRGASTLPVYSANIPSFVTGMDFSDHLNYWEAGYKAILVTDTSFYRNHRYHTALDKPETLDYNRMANVVLGVYASVLQL